MSMEKISVIVPIYNIERYLPKCLESIAGQTYRNLEIILVDDGSTDNSGRICDEFAVKDPRTRVIHQQNRGLWAARNTGQDAATGEYLFFPDGDDYFHLDMIRLLYEAINQGPKYDIAIAREKAVWNTEEDICLRITPKTECLSRQTMIQGLFAEGNDRYYVFMWNKLYRRSLIQGLRTNDYPRSQDFDFNIRAFLLANNAVIVDNDLYYWLQHSGSLTKEPDSLMMMFSCRIKILYRNYLDLSEENKKYGPLFLFRLYKSMALWKGYLFGSSDYRAVKKDCREYERSTITEYLRGEGINVFDKAGCLILLHFPLLMRLLLRVTHNI